MCGCVFTHTVQTFVYAHIHMHIIRTGSDKCSSETIEEESATHAPFQDIWPAKVENSNSVNVAAVSTKPTPDAETAFILERMRVFYSRFNPAKADEVHSSKLAKVDQHENE